MDAERRSPLEIFTTFARIALSSFGGAAFWMRRMLVEDRRWVSDREYLEVLAFAQILPGSNVVNVAIMLGHRFGGALGAFLALSGLIGPPLMIVLTLGLLYGRYASLPFIERALNGMTPVVAGLVIANAISLARALPRRARSWLFLGAAFAAVGALRWPLLGVLAVLAPLAIGWAWREKAD